MVSGLKRTCQPDTVAMLLFDFAIVQSRESVQKELMPNWQKDDAVAPRLNAVRDFYISKGLKMIARGDLSSNELLILQQLTGVFHLCAELTLLDGDGIEVISKHACVYNAASTFPGKAGRGVLRDNQVDVQPLLIEDCDRTDKFSARKAFFQFWPGCSTA